MVEMYQAKDFDVLGFGEVMLRLSPEGKERISQSETFEKRAGGSELNVVSGISQLGLRTGIITKLPDNEIGDVCALADVVHSNKNMAASISSGSFKTDGMIVIPCSMKTVAGIAAGYTDNLLLRSADVCLKEGRKVVIVPREMPLSRLHLRNIKEAADYGCVVVPPMLTFYNGSNSVEKQMQHIIGKVLMQFGIDYKHFVAWKGEE